MKGLSFFSHDVNARFDVKLRKLRKRYCSDALLFWDLLEEMGDSDGYYPLADIEFLSTDLNIDDERKQEIIDYAIGIGLFVKTDDDEIYSPRLTQFMQDFSAKSQKASAAAKARGKDDKGDNDNAEQSQSERKTNAEQSQSERKANAEQSQSERKAKKERKEEKKETTTTTTTEKKTKEAAAQVQPDVVVDVSSPQSQSVSDCDGLQNMSDEQIAGAIALLDSLGVDPAPSPVEVSAEDVNSILIDDDAAFDPDDDVIDYDTQQQQEADKAAAALIDDKSKMRDTLTKTYAITESLADIMLSKHDVSYIQNKIDLLAKQKNIDNPGAWLIKACREDYQVAAVTQEKPPTQSTRVYSDDLYDQFCQHFKRVFNQDFTHKALYENAVNLLGSESKVDYLLTVIDDYKGNPRIKEILTANHCHGFSEVMKSESAMGELIGFGMAQSSKDMAEKIKELPWMQQDKQGA